MIRLFEYNLPFKAPFKTATTNYDHRKGILIIYKTVEFSVLSEASPLPGFSNESFEDVKKTLLEIESDLNHFFDQNFDIHKLKSFLSSLPDLPSLQFSLSYLGIAVLARRKSASFANIMGVSFINSIQVNEIIGADRVSDIQEKIERGIKNGFTTFKLKAPYPVHDLAENLKDICSIYPHINIRLDANQTWPRNKITEIGKLLQPLPIEYIEEPVDFHNPEDIQKISSRLTIPVAIDESIQGISGLVSVLKSCPDLFLIVKPMILGNLFRIHETISKYRSNHTNIVVTTSLESVIGRTMIANVAALSGDPELAHGLNTGQFFKSDLVKSRPEIKGIINYPEWSETTPFSKINPSMITSLY